jgi:hypothetical protein
LPPAPALPLPLGITYLLRVTTLKATLGAPGGCLYLPGGTCWFLIVGGKLATFLNGLLIFFIARAYD